MKGSSSKLTAARGSMDKGSIILEPSRDPVSPRTREDLFITMEVTTTLEEDYITTVVLRMGMGMELTTIRTAPTRPLPPKET